MTKLNVIYGRFTENKNGEDFHRDLLVAERGEGGGDLLVKIRIKFIYLRGYELEIGMLGTC